MTSSDGKLINLKNLVLSNHHFARAVNEKLVESRDVFYSPFSIQIALLLAYSGADGETAKELEIGLHLFQDKQSTLNLISAFLKKLDNSKLHLVNEIFVEKSYKIKDEYKETTQKYFQSNFKQLDFKAEAEQARIFINQWISNHTEQKITDLIPPRILDEYTRLVLANAIYFKDNWRLQFETKNTVDEPFYVTETDFVNVPMMHLTNHFRYLEKESYQALELPYENTYFKMVILLPKKVDGLTELQNQLGSSNLFDVLQEMFRAKVNVSLPKFKMEKFTDIKTIFQSMGMTTIFTDSADFSDMYHPSEFPLCISDVLHKAVIEVNEEGSEAAAATAVAMTMLRCAAISEEETYDFTVNRPFIFYILCDDVILFFGKKSN